MAIKWELLNPLAPTNQFLTQGSNLFQQGLGGLGDAVKNFGTETRNENTNAILKSAMGIQSLDELPMGREGVLAALNAYGNGADGVKVMDALNKQESQLYTRQDNINQIDQYNRGVTAENRKLADLKLMNDPDIVKKALAGDASSLNLLSQLNDGSPLLDLYAKGSTAKKEEERFNITRGDRLKQDAFGNNIALTDSNIRVGNAMNPNPGATTVSYESDGKGGFIEVTNTTPTAADTFQAVAGNRNADGSINWGNTTQAAAKTAGGAAGHPQANTVSGNLSSLSKNLRADTPLRAAVNSLNVRDPKHLAMMAIESGGGGMEANSGSSIGPMQLNMKYAQANARKYGIKGDPTKDIKANIATGQAMVDDLSKKFNGNTDAIGIGYNGGESAAKVAYNAWIKAGQKGRVRDYIPSTYTSKGKSYKYDVTQMRNHADKYTLALSAMGGSKASNAPATPAADKPATTKTTGFNLAPGALATAKQSYNHSLETTRFAQNAANRKASTPVEQNALANFLEDNGINPNGSILKSAFKDNQNVYNTLSKNKDWERLPTADKQATLKEAITYTKNNQGWLFGKNPEVTQRVNRKLEDLVNTKLSTADESEYSALRAAAQGVIDKEKANKKRAGRLPTLSETMKLIDPEMYNRMRNKDKKVNNPY